MKKEDRKPGIHAFIFFNRNTPRPKLTFVVVLV